MNLKPTDVPLSVKDFDREVCGYCLGCSCNCGYIAYLKKDKIVDVYGHPYDPNSVGSLCNKGIALIAETDLNPLRVKIPLIRNGKEFRKASLEEIKRIVLKGEESKRAVLLGKFSTFEDYIILRTFTENIYTTGVFLPFKPSSIPPYQWKDTDLIITIEADPVMSEVMSTRWIIDAVEKGAYLINISSRFNTISAKAESNYILSPPQIKYALESILEGTEEHWSKIKKYLKSSKFTLIIVGETILKSPFRNNIINFVKLTRELFNAEYSFIGNITNVRIREIKDFCFDNYELIISVDNTLYEFENIPENKDIISFSLFPDITALHSKVVMPLTFFTEKDCIPLFNCFGYKTKSEKIKEGNDYIKEIFNSKNESKEVRVYENDLLDIKLEMKEEKVDLNDIYMVVGESLVEVWGHWYPWLHSIEPEQKVYMNKSTAGLLGLKPGDKLKGITVEITPAIADNTIFVPESFEESQPFNQGVRKGRILNRPGYRVWRYEDEH